jgi:hypothetical protein
MDVGFGFWMFLTAYIVTGAVVGGFVKDNFARQELLKWMSKTFTVVIVIWIFSLVVVMLIASLLA